MFTNAIIVEYIWLDDKYNYRSKTRILDIPNSKFEEDFTKLEWNYDGSSTNQAG
jgi:hypothetical protein